ncbi:hypothetical protein YT1_4893 [Rhodococcus ruber]|nr:hypothetical protein YT1_4893 [Rhodococcus ruber]
MSFFNRSSRDFVPDYRSGHLRWVNPPQPRSEKAPVARACLRGERCLHPKLVLRNP